MNTSANPLEDLSAFHLELQLSSICSWPLTLTSGNRAYNK